MWMLIECTRCFTLVHGMRLHIIFSRRVFNIHFQYNQFPRICVWVVWLQVVQGHTACLCKHMSPLQPCLHIIMWPGCSHGIEELWRCTAVQNVLVKEKHIRRSNFLKYQTITFLHKNILISWQIESKRKRPQKLRYFHFLCGLLIHGFNQTVVPL